MLYALSWFLITVSPQFKVLWVYILQRQTTSLFLFTMKSKLKLEGKNWGGSWAASSLNFFSAYLTVNGHWYFSSCVWRTGLTMTEIKRGHREKQMERSTAEGWGLIYQAHYMLVKICTKHVRFVKRNTGQVEAMTSPSKIFLKNNAQL